jgi:hypothetical protein
MATKIKVDVPKIEIEEIMNRHYMRFLFSDPTPQECDAILKKFKADERKVKRENPIYKRIN